MTTATESSDEIQSYKIAVEIVLGNQPTTPKQFDEARNLLREAYKKGYRFTHKGLIDAIHTYDSIAAKYL